MYSAENTIWVLLSAILMFVMQAGFAMLETGFTQVKNAGNIAMKNLLDFAIGSLVFSLVGFWIMFGTGNGAWLSSGSTETALHFLPAGVPLFAFLAYQTMFCATAATIASGAMAGRTKFVSYCVFSLILSMLIIPPRDPGSGAAAGCKISVFTILPAPRQSIWWGELLPFRELYSWGQGPESTPRMGKPVPFPDRAPH